MEDVFGLTGSRKVVSFPKKVVDGSYRELKSVTVNGKECNRNHNKSMPSKEHELVIHFEGTRLHHAMPVGTLPPLNNTGGEFATTFSVSQQMQDQLVQRAKDYPIQWVSIQFSTFFFVYI